jgi:hypothetical protein
MQDFAAYPETLPDRNWRDGRDRYPKPDAAKR